MIALFNTFATMVEKQIKNTEEIRNIEVCSKFDHLIMQMIINEVLEEHESDKVSFEIVRGWRKELPIAQSPSKMQNTLRECYVHFAVLSELMLPRYRSMQITY